MFLMGPLKQLKSMFHPTRIIASIVFVLAIVLTLVSAFVVSEIWQKIEKNLKIWIADWKCDFGVVVCGHSVLCIGMVLFELHTLCTHMCKECVCWSRLSLKLYTQRTSRTYTQTDSNLGLKKRVNWTQFIQYSNTLCEMWLNESSSRD